MIAVRCGARFNNPAIHCGDETKNLQPTVDTDNQKLEI